MASPADAALMAAVERAEDAFVVGSSGAARDAIPALTEALKAAGYTVPAPPRPSPAPAGWAVAGAAKGGVMPKPAVKFVKAPKTATAHAAKPAAAATQKAVSKKVIATAKSAAPTSSAGKPSLVQKQYVQQPAGGGAAKGGAAAKGGGGGKGGAVPAASAALQGSFKETVLGIEPAKFGTAVALEPLAADKCAAVVVAGLSSPENGVAAEGGSITLSIDANAGAVSVFDSVTAVKGCKMSASVHQGVLQLGRLLLQGGPQAMEDYNCVAYKCFFDVFRDTEGVLGKETTKMLAAICCEIALRAQPFILDDALSFVTTGSLKQLIASVEETGRPFATISGAGDGGGGAGSGDSAGAANVAPSGAAGGEVEAEMEAKVKGWIKAVAAAVASVDSDEKKAQDGTQGWRTGLGVWGRQVLVERMVVLEDFDAARKEVEAVAQGIGKCREGFLTMWKARICQAEYLRQVNSNPDLLKLSEMIANMVTAYKDAEAAADKEGDSGPGGGCRGALCVVRQGQAREEAKHIALIYAPAGQKGKQAGENQEATDQANLDEVAGLLKQRGVFGKPSVDESIQEMEAEYHDNIRLGLFDAAETVSNLLEWYRDYRTRLQRGGDMYAGKSTAPKEDAAIVAALMNAKECYTRALTKLAAPTSQLGLDVKVCAQEGLGRVLFLSAEWDAAISALDNTSDLSIDSALYLGLAKMERNVARGFAPEGPALVPVMGKALKALGTLSTRLQQGHHSVVENFGMLCVRAVRLNNPLAHHAGVRLGEQLLVAGQSKEAVDLLRSAIDGLVAMVSSTGVCQGAKVSARIWESRARIELVKNLDASGDKAGAVEQAFAIEDSLQYANKADADALDKRLANADLAVSVAPAWAKVHAIKGHVLWCLHENHPKRKGEAALLDQAEKFFLTAQSLEGQPKPPLPRPAPPPSATSPAPAKEGAAKGVASKGGAVKGGAAARPTTSAGGGAGGGGGGAWAGGGGGINEKLALVRIGLAKIKAERLGEVVADPFALKDEDRNSLVSMYEEAIAIEPRDIEPYYKVGELLELKAPARAAEVYARYPVRFDKPNQDDAFIAGEVVRLSMRGKDYLKWPKGGPEVFNVAKGLVVMAKVNSLSMIESYVDKLAQAKQTAILCEVYAAINDRAIDDPEMQTFFHRQGWVAVAPPVLKSWIHGSKGVFPGL